MTEDMTSFSPQDRSGGVYDIMVENDFDIAPVEAAGHIRWFVKRSDLRDVSHTDAISDHCRNIEEGHLVGSETPVIALSPDARDVLHILEEREKMFSFVVRDGIEGIITHAEFNKLRVGSVLYELISEFEEAVSDLIVDEIEGHDRWMSVFDEEDQEDIKWLYGMQEKENAELRLVDCLLTSQLIYLINHFRLWRELGLDEDGAREVLNEIKSFRDAVMHQRPVVGKHSFQEFVQIVSELKEINQNLDRKLP